MVQCGSGRNSTQSKIRYVSWEQLSVREKISTFQHNPITSFLSYKLIKLFPYDCGLFLGCCMTLTQDEKSVIVYSGYSKKALKKDVDKGTIHEDLFTLSKSAATRHSHVG